jgi:hypothetical protein
MGARMRSKRSVQSVLAAVRRLCGLSRCEATDAQLVWSAAASSLSAASSALAARFDVLRPKAPLITHLRVRRTRGSLSSDRSGVRFGFRYSSIVSFLMSAVGEHVRIRVGSPGEVALADVFADPLPRHTAEMHQRDPTVSHVVGLKVGTHHPTAKHGTSCTTQ